MFIRRERAVSQSGQVALVILLLMVALLIAGLSLASSSVQDLMLSTSQQESSRVFSAAEGGIEEALSSNFDFSGEQQLVNLPGFYEGADVNYRITKQSILDIFLFEGVVAKVDLAGVAAASSPALDIDWSAESNCATQDPASLLVSIYSQESGAVKVRHYALASCDRGDEMALAGSSAQTGLNFYYQLPLTTNDLFARIKPVYNDTKLRVAGVNFTLPTQYYEIRSQADNVYGDESRAVTVSRSLPTAPSVFDYVLYSGTDLIK